MNPAARAAGVDSLNVVAAAAIACHLLSAKRPAERVRHVLPSAPTSRPSQAARLAISASIAADISA